MMINLLMGYFHRNKSHLTLDMLRLSTIKKRYKGDLMKGLNIVLQGAHKVSEDIRFTYTLSIATRTQLILLMNSKLLASFKKMNFFTLLFHWLTLTL